MSRFGGCPIRAYFPGRLSVGDAKMGGMRMILRIAVSSFALWLTTLIVGGSGEHGFWIRAYEPTEQAHVVTLVLVALAFGLVNATLGKIVRFVSIPLYIITFGLFAFIVNGLMVSVVVWLSNLAGFGLEVSGFWWGVLGAFVMSLLAGLMNSILGTKKRKDRK